uniref:Uncharacterized protein n=1 Tax=Alexandrium catenella TaxID=2925 RepID=A0A7S1RPY3_ALECA
MEEPRRGDGAEQVDQEVELARLAAPAAPLLPVEEMLAETVMQADGSSVLSSDASEDELAAAGDTIIIGPTDHAVRFNSFEEMGIPHQGVPRPVQSRERAIYLSDVRGLTELGRGSAPLSFGSLLHVCCHRFPCRPCMFEKRPGCCRKSWLCDFCHLHARRDRRG